jgi:hypothetical protein
MLIARWQIDARFGQKQQVIEMLRRWAQEIAPQIGWPVERGRLLTGSIGAREATVVHEWSIPDLADLDRAWAALGKLDAHAAWGRTLEPHVVSGSSRWEVFRVL